MMTKARITAPASGSNRPLGLGHWEHPLLGQRVIDHAHDDRVGVLRALAPDIEQWELGPVTRVPVTAPMAWLAPVSGGAEWTTHPDAIEAERNADVEWSPETRVTANASGARAAQRRSLEELFREADKLREAIQQHTRYPGAKHQ
ncbi:hypothetical protein MOV08_29200 [Streptomyces yunnanensis]|uniref:Uncharacterized protein n=1 Tax=Streptomyces yunnanensis TaxID=156453 RepID=A0ABY8AG80_9ACTN|nr:hypothetical protein [Streptomyces yunnanensis]WEB42930.1 hypothetical protein MOV08_29200 [Streptomyces yunnanensis]